MGFKIIRGILLGTVIGVVVGVSLSGAMYMFNYMRDGIGNYESKAVMVDSMESKGRSIEMDEASYVPSLIIPGSLKPSYDHVAVRDALRNEGISGMAKTIAASSYDVEGLEYVESMEEKDVIGDNLGISDELLRFHVKANSNSDVDIALKYKVRDAVLGGIEENMTRCKTKEEAWEYLNDNLEYIEEIALSTLRQEGYSYAVNAYTTNDYFPIRQYGDIVLPAGNYDALRIDIGLANGENFWCLLYPTMCFPKEAGAVITNEGKQELKKSLTKEQYEKLFVNMDIESEDTVKVKFKLVEWLEELLD